ncbi:MAG: glutamate-5-semialdehyde dehydrogenase [Myxococcales bacterium]|nr:glutamate-5-semialdehyde dehydrogenase [Myxococcales bacterium]
MDEDEIDALVERLAEEAKAAARRLARLPTERKDAVLRRVCGALRGPAGDALLEANRRDLLAAEGMALPEAMLDRLRLDRPRLDAVADGVEAIVALPDPVGRVEDSRKLPNGLSVSRVRVPLGLIGFIYESRPNVTADAAALCIKSGNAILLRGGKEAFESNRAFAAIFEEALEAEGLPKAAVTLLPTVDRRATLAMIRLVGVVDLVIPRGGEGLIRFVSENARVPVIQHYKGMCHVYVDGGADLDAAEAIAVNAKVHRPGVCNAMETLLVDRAIAEAFLPRVSRALLEEGVELRGDPAVCALVPEARAAVARDWDTEHLSKILNVAVVDGIDAALVHIERHGSKHTEAIVTDSYARAQRWVREVDASLVLVNASTRFNDGFQLGLGAEIGISTTKLHAYGPMGLAELCTLKWVGYGEGQIRR